jgi:hypothetical protein
MKEIDFGQNCSLTRYLEKMSSLDGVSNNSSSTIAGALLFGLGYPHFTKKSPDIRFTEQLIQQIPKYGQTTLLSEASQKCAHCPHSGNCNVEELFKVS